MARFTLLALGAAAEAIQDSGIDCEAEAENITSEEIITEILNNVEVP